MRPSDQARVLLSTVIALLALCGPVTASTPLTYARQAIVEGARPHPRAQEADLAGDVARGANRRSRDDHGALSVERTGLILRAGARVPDASRPEVTSAAWMALAIACAVLVWAATPAAGAGRRDWALAALALGPLGVAAWLATRRRDPGGRDRGAWSESLSRAARWVPSCVAGTVAAIAVIEGMPPAAHAPAWQLAALYLIPVAIGWGAWTDASPGRFLRAVVCGNLALAGIWVTVLAVLGGCVTAADPTWARVVVGWCAAATGAGIGLGLVAGYLWASPGAGWRDGWWWTPISVGALLLGLTTGVLVARLIEAWPVIALVSAATRS